MREGDSEGGEEDVCYGIRRITAALAYESDHHALRTWESVGQGHLVCWRRVMSPGEERSTRSRMDRRSHNAAGA